MRDLHRDVPPGTERAWELFMEASPRSARDLVRLLGENIHPGIQKRAMDTLFSPNPQTLPFPVNLSSQRGSDPLFEVANRHHPHGIPRYWRTALRPDQADYVAEIAMKNYEAGHRQFDLRFDEERPTSQERISPFEYGRLMIDLIPIVPEVRAHQIIGTLKVDHGDNSAGVVRNVYHDAEIDESFKRPLAERVRQYVTDTEGLELWDVRYRVRSTLDHYANTVMSLVAEGDVKGVSDEFLLGELAFLLENSDHFDRSLVYFNRTLLDMAKAIPDDELRKQVVLREVAGVKINTDREYRDAIELVKSYRDRKINEPLVQKIHDYEEAGLRIKEQEVEKEERDTFLIEQMENPSTFN